MDVPGYALITGGASGIGKATAATLIREGAAGVALLDLRQESLDAAKNEIIQLEKDGVHCRIETFVLDVSNEEQVIKVVNEVAKAFGRIDYVVNAAGIGGKHPGGAAYAETSDWQRILNVNLNGSFYVLRESAKIMLRQTPILSAIDGRELQRGSIVNFSSIQGVVGISDSAAYAASKHAIVGLTRSASEDYAKDGLRINCICPGYTETPLTTQSPLILSAMKEKVASSVPMRRMARPQEIADGVVYLCGGRSSFVVGTALAVDGGYTQR